MQPTLLTFTLATSFFMACCALNDDNLQLLPETISILPDSGSDPNYRSPDASLDDQKTFPNLIDINNNNNGANLPPDVFDQSWLLPSGDANLGETHTAVAAAATTEGPDAQISPPFNGNVIKIGEVDCHGSETFRRREEEEEEDQRTKNRPPPLLCPVLPGQKTAPLAPAAGAGAAEGGEEAGKEPVRGDGNEKDRQRIIDGPPPSSVVNKFDLNGEICPPDIYGALRQVPVCHSGDELLKKFDSNLGSWTLWNIRPCKFLFFSFFTKYFGKTIFTRA